MSYDRAFGDDLLSTDKRLKYKWKWSRVASRISEEEIKTWTHFQVSDCKIGEWRLQAVQWPEGEGAVSYEAQITYRGNSIARQGVFKTRIDAQIVAEKLLETWLTKEYNRAMQE